MSPTVAAKEREFQSKQANRAFILSLLTLIVTAVSAGGTLWYTIYRDHKQATSFDASFGKLSVRIGKLETALRLLVAHSAPEFEHELDESLREILEDRTQQASVGFKRITQSSVILHAGQVPLSNERDGQIKESLLKSINLHWNMPEAWMAASSYASYRSDSYAGFRDSETKLCFEQPLKGYTPHPSNYNTRINDILVGNCVLDIDDIDTFERSIYGKGFRAEQAQGVTDVFRLIVNDAVIRYNGKKLLPFAAFFCRNCTFISNIDAIPPDSGQRLLEYMVAAQKPNDIQMPSGI